MQGVYTVGNARYNELHLTTKPSQYRENCGVGNPKLSKEDFLGKFGRLSRGKNHYAQEIAALTSGQKKTRQ